MLRRQIARALVDAVGSTNDLRAMNAEIRSWSEEKLARAHEDVVRYLVDTVNDSNDSRRSSHSLIARMFDVADTLTVQSTSSVASLMTIGNVLRELWRSEASSEIAAATADSSRNINDERTIG